MATPSPLDLELRGGTAIAPGPAWFGHPRGLGVLFFTEFWERFSYYGMRALLVLYMAAPLAGANPGLGLSVPDATAIYGLYTAMVYLMALPGGWIADRLWGQRKSVFVGGCVIAAGHFTMASPLAGVPDIVGFGCGLALIVIGTGLLKPNVSAMVGDLYDDHATADARRDAGFTLFYMGINLGAIAGPLLCGYFAETVAWHWGFSLAGIGMVAGLAQYRAGGRHLGRAGLLDDSGDLATRARRGRIAGSACISILLAALLAATLVARGVVGVDFTALAAILGSAIVMIAVGYFAWAYAFGGHDPGEKRRLLVIFWLFVLSALFWSGFEQAGSSMNLFAERLTDRAVGGFEVPASWLQTVNPVFIVLLAPVLGMFWTWTARRNAHPSVAMKFALAFVGLAAGFFVLAWGAANASTENPASPAWLIVTYFLHTVGELCLSPVGLSAITRLSPAGRVGQMMGMWFIGAALGSLIAGLLAGRIEASTPSALFYNVALFAVVAGLLALLASPLARRLAAGPQ